MNKQNSVIEVLSSCFYVGYLPASGTFATILCFPLVIIFNKLNFLAKIIFFSIFLFFSVYISNEAEKIFNNKDDRRIVIDEVIGFLIATLGINPSFFNLMLSLLIFRFFDILKIFGIKKIQKLPSGFGIVVDDIFAGVLSNIVLRLILFLL